MALNKGDVISVNAIRKLIPALTSREIFAYSTTAGETELREA